MLDLAEGDIETKVRAGMAAYEQHQMISQAEHARRLGVDQKVVNLFLRGRYTLTARVARAVYAVHPELRPILHAWLAARAEDASPSGAPASPDGEGAGHGCHD